MDTTGQRTVSPPPDGPHRTASAGGSTVTAALAVGLLAVVAFSHGVEARTASTEPVIRPILQETGQEPAYVLTIGATHLAGIEPADRAAEAGESLEGPSDLEIPVTGYAWENETPLPGQYGAGTRPAREMGYLTVECAVGEHSELLAGALERDLVIPAVLLQSSLADDPGFRLSDVTVRKISTRGAIERITFRYRSVEEMDGGS